MAYHQSLAYGPDHLEFTFRRTPEVLTITEPEAPADGNHFRQVLSAAIDRTAPDLSRPAVVVADKTRLCGYPEYLPILLETLTAHGAAPQCLTLWIAYGTHAPQSEDESRNFYGPAYGEYRWRQHRCDRAEDFVELGATRRGTPVRLPAAILNASCLITFGAISHHYFAGYGGGRKLIFPGLGEKRAIYANHGLFLDRAARTLSPGCQPGALAGNPLAEDLTEVEAFRPADLAVHGILDSHGRVCELRVGCGPAHFTKACNRQAELTEVDRADMFDLVLASCGGFPKDINFIQSHKAVHHASAFVRDGGRLIVLAQCRDGIGSQTFLPWFELGWETAFDRLAADYQGNGGTALALMAKTRRIRIALVTELPADLAARIGCEVLCAQEVERLLHQHTGTPAVIPNASLLVRKRTTSHPQS
jgi:lactate racemase